MFGAMHMLPFWQSPMPEQFGTSQQVPYHPNGQLQLFGPVHVPPF